MTLDQGRVPACPITGLPAVRHIQWVPALLLIRLWRIEFKTDPRPSFDGVDRFGLWESPTGLYFFDPPVEGDDAFYEAFYSRLRALGLYSKQTARPEFVMAARHVKPGARVLDIGCGLANFRTCVPQATYTGLDPHVAEGEADGSVCSETLAQHLVNHTGAYDAVCAFQVLEHVKAPVSLFAEMVQAVKPGGLIMVGVPHVPSAMTRIPNFLMNAPPHHLTWWTKSALIHLAKDVNVVIDSIENVPWGKHDALIYWIEHCTPFKSASHHYSEAWSWHASAAAGLASGAVAHWIRGVPSTDDEGSGLLLVARRPCGLS